jgi:hypothetical protein
MANSLVEFVENIEYIRSAHVIKMADLKSRVTQLSSMMKDTF